MTARKEGTEGRLEFRLYTIFTELHVRKNGVPAAKTETDGNREYHAVRFFLRNSNCEFETKNRPDERCRNYRRIDHRFWYFCFPERSVDGSWIGECVFRLYSTFPVSLTDHAAAMCTCARCMCACVVSCSAWFDRPNFHGRIVVYFLC